MATELDLIKILTRDGTEVGSFGKDSVTLKYSSSRPSGVPCLVGYKFTVWGSSGASHSYAVRGGSLVMGENSVTNTSSNTVIAYGIQFLSATKGDISGIGDGELTKQGYIYI